MEKKEQHFLDKTDYKSYIIIAIVFSISFIVGDAIGAFFGDVKLFAKTIFCGLGAVIGVAIARLFYKGSLGLDD